MRRVLVCGATALLLAAVMTPAARAGWLDSKVKSIGRGVSHAAKVAGRDISRGYKHVTRTPVRPGRPNWRYIRRSLNHRPFANDRGELGKRLGGWSNQDFAVYAGTTYLGGASADAVMPADYGRALPPPLQIGRPGVAVGREITRYGVSRGTNWGLQRLYWQGKRRW